MTTHTTRPAVALAWVLGLILALKQPQIISTMTHWTLDTPAGTAVLATAFVVALTRVIRYRRWG